MSEHDLPTTTTTTQNCATITTDWGLTDYDDPPEVRNRAADRRLHTCDIERVHSRLEDRLHCLHALESELVKQVLTFTSCSAAEPRIARDTEASPIVAADEYAEIFAGRVPLEDLPEPQQSRARRHRRALASLFADKEWSIFDLIKCCTDAETLTAAPIYAYIDGEQAKVRRDTRAAIARAFGVDIERVLA